MSPSLWAHSSLAGGRTLRRKNQQELVVSASLVQKGLLPPSLLEEDLGDSTERWAGQP